MAAVPQQSKMVLVLLGSVFLHAESHHQWLVPWYREHDTKTLCLFKVRSVNSKPLEVQCKASPLFPIVTSFYVFRLFLYNLRSLRFGKEDGIFKSESFGKRTTSRAVIKMRHLS